VPTVSALCTGEHEMNQLVKEILNLTRNYFSLRGGNPFYNHHTVFNHLAVLREGLRILNASQRLRLLDVGGGDGSFLKSIIDGCDPKLKEIFQIDVLDIAVDRAMSFENVNFRGGDICSPDLTRDVFERFDGLFSYNALEHFQDPFIAAENMVELIVPGGLLLCSTVFSWRFHPVPNDYYRFSDQALEYIFSKRNGLKTIVCGYDLSRRRENIAGGLFGDKDVPPFDLFGGFRENWIVTYLGQKLGK